MDLIEFLECVIAMSGEVDYVSDGTTVVKIENGNRYQGLITGAGCMTTTSIAVFASQTSNALHATVAGYVHR